jgi:haloalkane dehalogenase
MATTIANEKKPLPRPPWLPQTVWPFQTVDVDVDSIRLAVTDVGQGPAMLFIHTGA